MAVTVEHAVAGASGQPVVAAGAKRIGASQNIWPFVPTSSNIVDGKALTFVEANYDLTPSAAVNDELADYLVLSTCGHVFDGWRYLSQAAISLLNGARNHALHLAYYAELRAALSILAGSGVGVLKRKHFALNASGGIDWFDRPTHETAWRAITEWSKTSQNAMKVVRCLEAIGISASDWAEACNASPSLQQIAASWLQDWSIDLEKLESDRTLRNEASYRPDLRPAAFATLGATEIELVREISTGCAFEGSGRFQSIDLVLMHDLCSKACEVRFGIVDTHHMQLVWNDVIAWLHNHKGLDTNLTIEHVALLKKASSSIGGDVVRKADVSNADVSGVFSRAFLLLRLASALVRQQWEEIRVLSGGGKSAWQSVTLTAFGNWSNLWQTGAQPTDYGMLDEDRIEAEESLDNWLAANPQFVPFKMWREIPGAVVELCRFERVGLLAIAP